MRLMNTLKALLAAALLTISLPLYADSMLSPLTDTVNSGIINSKMELSDSLSGINVDATVINGIAIFTGEVSSKAQARELARIARSVSGIKGIDMRGLKLSGKR